MTHGVLGTDLDCLDTLYGLDVWTMALSLKAGRAFLLSQASQILSAFRLVRHAVLVGSAMNRFGRDRFSL